MVSYAMAGSFRCVSLVGDSYIVIPGQREAANSDVQLHIRESIPPLRMRPDGFRACAFGAFRNDGSSYFFGGEGHGRCGPRRPSNVLAMPSTPRSSKRRPTICTPIGKPLAS